MKLPSSILALVLLGSVLSDTDAQTLRTVTLKVAYVSYLDTRSGTPVRTPHWVADPGVAGTQLIARDASFWTTFHASWGSVSLSGTAYPQWVDSVQTMSNSCSTGTLYSDVMKAVGTPSTNIFGKTTYSLPAGTTLVIVMPNGTPCNDTAGGSTIYTVNGSFIEHETGHILGLSHPNQQICNAGVCQIQSYAQYSIMGNGVDLNVFERDGIGAYSPTYQLARLTTTGDVTLQLSNTATAGIKGAVLLKTVSVPHTQTFLGMTWVTTVKESHDLWVEYRNGDYASKGVIVWATTNRALIDFDQTNVTRYRMNVGETWKDWSYVSVTLTAVTETTATVHLSDAP